MDDLTETEIVRRFTTTLESEVRMALEEGLPPKAAADALIGGGFMLAARLAGDRAPAVEWLHRCADTFMHDEGEPFQPH